LSIIADIASADDMALVFGPLPTKLTPRLAKQVNSNPSIQHLPYID
jgi:hypothetical protein